MGQTEMLALLEKEKKWMSSREIKDCLDDGKSTVSRVCGILFKTGDIDRKRTKKSKTDKGYSWKYK